MSCGKPIKALLAMGRKADFHDQNDIACFPRCYVLVKLRFGKNRSPPRRRQPRSLTFTSESLKQTHTFRFGGHSADPAAPNHCVVGCSKSSQRPSWATIWCLLPELSVLEPPLPGWARSLTAGWVQNCFLRDSLAQLVALST